ncbi:MAG: glycosyltransferase [Microscillaceae bacterium]|nr:glycosyltransferase [Microscillaceae bacterium]MDW8461207.1 glycosyltransferase [Cytophagales bacterium]
MPKILFLSYDGLTDALGQSQVLPYLLGLSQQGFAISIISAEKQDNYALRREVITQIIEKNNQTTQSIITWQPIFYTKKPPVFSTLYDIWKMQRKAQALHKQQQFDIIHCRSYIPALIGLRLKHRLGLPFIFDMRGFWADERVDGGLWNLKNPLFRQIYTYFKQKEKQFLQQAAYTISLTEKAKQEILSWSLPQVSPIEVIPCCADLQHFYPQNQTQQTNSQGLTISYLGSIGTWYMLSEMLAFYKQLLQTYPQAEFLFITPDSPAHIRQEAQKLGLPLEQIRIQKAERKDIPTLLAQSQISLFFIKPAFSKKASSPTKTAEILGMGIPIIANQGVGDNDFLFQNYTCGTLIADFSEQSFAQAIAQIPKLLQIPKEKLRQTALDYFSLEKGVKQYAKIYKQILAKK